MNIAKQKKIIGGLRDVLRENGEDSWAKMFQDLLQSVEEQPTARTARHQITQFKKYSLGGMGGATDIIFYRNGKILREETDRYYELLSHLGTSWWWRY